ncbi:MAG: acyl-CoA thioesterase [Pacificimonas sp.]|jgi:acyl-CoA thioester hydrolase|nr:acyl-CoA thioesterase [Pacificimonas sp.]
MTMRQDPARRQRETYPFGFEMHVRFADMDVNAHLNNVAFARFFEEGRVRLHHALGGKQKLAFRPIVANLTVDFLGEGGWPEPVEVRCGIAKFGRSSYVVAQALFQGDRCIGLGETVMVNKAEDGPGGAPLPDSLTQPLAAYRLTGQATQI